MNNQQRQLSQKEKAEQIRARLLTAPELSNRTIAKFFNCSHNTISKIREEMIKFGQIDHTDTSDTEWLKHPFLIQNPDILTTLNERGLRTIKSTEVLDIMLDKNLTSPIYAQRLINKGKKAARKNAAVKLTTADIKLFCADIQEGLLEVVDKCVNCIICDPPYQKSAIPLYKNLSEVSERLLCDDGGILAVMSGTAHLPEVMQAMSTCEQLKYFWTIANITPRGSHLLQYRSVMPAWKPIIIFVKGKYKGELIRDIITAPPSDSDKSLHKWGQSLSTFTELVERFTNPGDTIFDPFIGAGTTGIATIKLGRKFIGSDIDPQCVETTRIRIAEVLSDS